MRTVTATTVGFAAAGGLAFASSSPVSAGPCGFYATAASGLAYYKHCGPRAAAVKVEISTGDGGRKVEVRCLPPGNTLLGAFSSGMTNGIVYASSGGEPC